MGFGHFLLHFTATELTNHVRAVYEWNVFKPVPEVMKMEVRLNENFGEPDLGAWPQSTWGLAPAVHFILTPEQCSPGAAGIGRSSRVARR
jgi:hypothetical protein